MRKNFGAKTWLYPMPVLIVCAYDENGKANCMNAAWGGICEENQIVICLDDGHKTTSNIIKAKAFTVGVGTKDTMVACDYVGIVSGNTQKDKMQKAGFTTTKSEFVNAPIIDQLPFILECKVISYDSQTCALIGEIVNVSIDESVLDEKGKVDVNKLQPITYDSVNLAYRVIGEVVGKAFCDGKKLKV